MILLLILETIFTLPLRLPLKTMQRYECVRTQQNILVIFTLKHLTY